MRHAAYCGSREIYSDMVTSAKSLAMNSDVDRIWFFVEDDEFPFELPDLVECVNVSNQTFFDRDGPNMSSGYTYLAMMRAALCHMIDADKVLSLDADVIFTRDVSGIWDIDVSGCYFAATPEWHRSKNGLMYCNHGVVLYNLDMMRDGKADEVISVLNSRKYTWVEQDVCNYLCQGRIAAMPSDFNQNYWTDRHGNEDASVVHFAGIKRSEWVDKPIARRYARKSWKEVMGGRSSGGSDCGDGRA